MNTFGLIVLLAAALCSLSAFGLAIRSNATGTSSRSALALLWMASIALLTAAAALLWQLIVSDPSNSYVVQHSAASMPAAYRAASFWAGQEGSLLLWSNLVALVAVGVCTGAKATQPSLRPWTIAAAALLVLTMCTLLILGANPFQTTSAITQPSATTLQLRHWAMLIHPPLIFAGYALAVAPCIIAAGGLLARADSCEWIATMRIWAMAAWITLGAGITIGAWWAYTQLGWGGYWAWDPVENASLIPWLTLMGLVHALAVHRRRGTLAFWCVVLALGTFILCAFGTFITRGGMVQSIHSFGKSTIGWYLATWIILLSIAAGLLALRSRRSLTTAAEGRNVEAVCVASIGIFLLLLSAAAVLTGTVTPMFASLVRSTPVWVGRGFYETVVGPLAMSGALMMALAPMIGATSQRAAAAWQQPLPAIAAGLLAAIACRVAGLQSLQLLLCIWMCGVALWFTVGAYLASVRGRLQSPDATVLRAIFRAWAMQSRAHGTRISHLGVTVLLMGVCTSTILTRSFDLTLKVGEQIHAGPWKVSLQKIAAESTPDGSEDVVIRSEVACADASGASWMLTPSRRHMLGSDQPIAHVAIHSSWTGDCFVALGDWNDSTGSVALHVASLPGLIWIWIGAVLTALGGLICAFSATPKAVAVSGLSTINASEPTQTMLAMESVGAQS